LQIKNGYKTTTEEIKYEAQPCWVISTLSPENQKPITMDRYFIEKDSGIIIGHESYENGILVLRSIYKNFAINNLDDSVFDTKKF